MWIFEQEKARSGNVRHLDEGDLPCVVLRRGRDGIAGRRADGTADDAGVIASALVRSGAGVEGMLRAGLLVPLGTRERRLVGDDVPDVINVDEWDDDDDVVDDDDDEEEDEDDEVLPDDADDFDDDEDEEEDEEDE